MHLPYWQFLILATPVALQRSIAQAEGDCIKHTRMYTTKEHP